MQVGRSGWPIGTKTKPLFLDMVSSQAMVSLSFVSYSLIFFGNESFSYKFYKSSPIFVSIPSISYFKVFNIKLSRGKTIIQLGFAQNKIVKLKFFKHFSSIYSFVSKRIYIQVSSEGVQRVFNLFSYIICRSMHFLRSNLDKAFSVKTVDDVCASKENNYLYSK